jgi:hypothetical protein
MKIIVLTATGAISATPLDHIERQLAGAGLHTSDVNVQLRADERLGQRPWLLVIDGEGLTAAVQ